MRVLPVLTEPSPSLCPVFAPWRRIHLSDGVRWLWPGAYSGVVPGAAPLWHVRVKQQEAERTLRRGGGGHSSMASARCLRGAETVHSAVSPLQLGPSRPPPISNSRGTLRRRRAPAEDSSRRPERSPAPATVAAALWFQSQRQRAMARLWRTQDGARTAARLRRRLLA